MSKATAVITGASVGIGAEFARKLAKEYNLILIARNKGKLEELKSSLDCESQVIVADLSVADEVAKVEKTLKKDSSISLLVNNAGFGTAGEFHTLDLESELQEINLNVMALVRLSHAVLPNLVAKKEGAIINVSSVASFLVTPLSTTYSATKAYVRSFSESLAAEVNQYGVTVQALCPGLTRTEFQERAGLNTDVVPDFMWMTSAQVVDESLARIASKQPVVVPGIINDISAKLAKIIPGRLLAGFTQNIMTNAIKK